MTDRTVTSEVDIVLFEFHEAGAARHAFGNAPVQRHTVGSVSVLLAD